MENIAFGVLITAFIILLYLSISDLRKRFSSEGANALSVGTKKKWQERREVLRVKIKWPVTTETTEGPLNGETLNISTAGTFICFQKVPRLKETFHLTINPPNHQAITVTAEIIWSNFNVPESEVRNRGMGVRFLEISDEDRQFISQVVADHQQKNKQND
jgi:c-di-GMP-binding flagellar brake protein YcgR